MGGQRFELLYPVVLSMLHYGADFVLWQGSMVLDLFQENEPGVVVEAMAWGVKVFVE